MPVSQCSLFNYVILRIYPLKEDRKCFVCAMLWYERVSSALRRLFDTYLNHHFWSYFNLNQSRKQLLDDFLFWIFWKLTCRWSFFRELSWLQFHPSSTSHHCYLDWYPTRYRRQTAQCSCSSCCSGLLWCLCSSHTIDSTTYKWYTKNRCFFTSNKYALFSYFFKSKSFLKKQILRHLLQNLK